MYGPVSTIRPVAPVTSKGCVMFGRRTIYVSILAALAATVPAASAATSKAAPKKPTPPRVVTITYSQPCPVSVAATNVNGSGGSCPADQEFATLKGEKFRVDHRNGRLGTTGGSVVQRCHGGGRRQQRAAHADLWQREPSGHLRRGQLHGEPGHQHRRHRVSHAADVRHDQDRAHAQVVRGRLTDLAAQVAADRDGPR
jgi:hypothetical protein